MKQYRVYENGAGNLTLAVYGERGIEYIHTGYEFRCGSLREDIEAIKSGDDPLLYWDGNDIEMFLGTSNPAEYNEKAADLFENNSPADGICLIADNNGIYPEKMGVNGAKEFGIYESEK